MTEKPKSLVKICPKCGASCRNVHATVDNMFGHTQDYGNANIKAQSWCRDCRKKQVSEKTLKARYARVFPNDKTRRSLPTMRARLEKFDAQCAAS